MGLTAALQGKRVYFDTNIFIYLIEGNEELTDAIAALTQIINAGSCEVVSSQITFTEILPPIVRSQNPELLSQVMEFLQATEVFSWVSTDSAVAVHAGFLRGEVGMKTPDAIHVASALQAGCDLFLTNDRGIRVPDGIDMLVFSDFSGNADD